MKRRSYLGAMTAAGITGVAGCLGDGVGDILSSDGTDTTLDPPEQSRGDPIHPIHGDEFPTVSLPDPLRDEEISLEQFEGDRAYMMTFIYTSCTEDCATLVRLLSEVQSDAAERGYEDDIAFLAMTFDPETDGPEELREYGETNGADIEADNWHFLRPESNEEALRLINDDIGAPADLENAEQNHEEHGDEDSDHDDHGGNDDADDGEQDDGSDDSDHGDDHDDGEHDHGDGDDHDGSDADHGSEGVHYYTMFLVNDRGIVERSYPNVTGDGEENRPASIIDNVRTVVE